MITQAAVFLDKDGTLVEDVPYNVDPQRVRFYPEVPGALAGLAALGYRLVVVSNQPGVALGYFDEAALDELGRDLSRRFAAAGVMLTAFRYCPHHAKGRVAPYAVACECRKPASGLIEAAARECGIDLDRSWMIGDILNDVEAGNRAGCRSLLVDRGNETEWLPGRHRTPEFVVRDLAEAYEYIAENPAASARRAQP